jgi:hypothetical protein
MLKLLRRTIEFIFFIFQLIKDKGQKSQVKKEYKGELIVLANGPSLKTSLESFSKGITREYKNCDFIVMNYFALDEVFLKIKPRHYCLVDPMFFQDSHRSDDVKGLFKTLQNFTSWNLNLYIPLHQYDKFKLYSQLTNPFINIIKVNVRHYYGYEGLRHYFYSKGLAIPPVKNVSILAIYTGILSGYNKISLYGVDHTFFDSLFVNEANQICNIYKHFNDNSEKGFVSKPIKRNDNGQIWKLSDYLKDIAQMFASHDLLEGYSKKNEVKIINCTKNSMIDSFDRK